jgi:murein DD-endopeptidase MepM/ murein hydrolase activator NlpD
MIRLDRETSRQAARLRVVLMAATAFTLAACSGSADRLADFSDVNTSSLPAEQTADVEAAPLQEGQQQSARPAWQNAGQDAGTSSGGGSYSDSGTVTVQSGQTIYSIARANNLSPDELARANNIAPPYDIRVGQRLTVPGRANPVAPSLARAEPQTIQAANAPTSQAQFGQNDIGGNTHVVRPGETLFAVGRSYGLSPFTIAEHNQLREPYDLRVGQTLSIPSSGAIASRRDERPSSGQPMTLDQQMAARQDAQAQDTQQPNTQVQFDQQARAPEAIAAPPSSQATPDQRDGAMAATFRWPVKGRVISTFGEKPTGMRNEGINIAVPEGTSVRAAGSGIVAYAGNELKGYGNLVLIRHDGGWVTAYAHNKELFVNRGDSVSRGDVIANAGQTGSVTSPQVHFEVRKGATAVDPMKHLDTEQAMN